MTLPPLHSLDNPPPVNWRLLLKFSPVLPAVLGVIVFLSVGMPWRLRYAVQFTGKGFVRTLAERDVMGDRPYDYLVFCQDLSGCRRRAAALCRTGFVAVADEGWIAGVSQHAYTPSFGVSGRSAVPRLGTSTSVWLDEHLGVTCR